MTSVRTRFTRADYERLPEGFPCELLEGELVKEPAPVYRHQRIVVRLVCAIRDRIGVDRVVCSPIDVALDDLNVLQPDVAVFAEPLTADLVRVPIPALVVEVLSPTTATRDRGRKTRAYLGHGVAEVWLVDPRDGAIEVCTTVARSCHRPEETVTSTALPEVTLRGCDLLG